VTAEAVVIALAGLVVAAAVLFAGARVASILARGRRDATIQHLQGMFGPAMQAVQDDPRRFLVWYPVAEASRRLYPEACAQLDAVTGSRFPFSPRQLDEAHAQWTAEWLAWERAHDGEYTLRTAALQEELTRAGEATTPLGRARMGALEREKLERYQQRYQDYIRTARALQALQTLKES